MKAEIFSEPIDHILSRSGFCSLRSASTFIKNHEILVNGKKVEFRTENADIERDKISIDGKILEKQKHIYLLMNKPLGFVCSTVSDSHKTVFSLLPDELKTCGGFTLHTIGRLDSDSSGLLLFTTNGRLSNFLTRPESHLKKKYFIELKNPVSEKDMAAYKNAFSAGINLPEYKHGKAFTTKPAEIEFTGKKNCCVIISEGKFRQIRRMFFQLNNEVTILKRIRIGNLLLPENLKEGEFIILSSEEIKKSLLD